MATYNCPQCQKQLVKGQPPAWVKWFIGPLFGLCLRPLILGQHGEIPVNSLPPEQQGKAHMARTIGIVGGGILNVLVLALLIFAAVYNK